MGIYIVLTRTYAGASSLRELALARLDHCIEAIRFFKQELMFVPENVELWKGAHSKALGGELLETLEIKSLFEVDKALRERLAKRLSFENLLQTVIVFNGVWSLNGVDLAVFFSIQNNRRLRNIYRDIEIDAYGKKDIEDLVDALWQMEERSEIISRFVKSIKRGTKKSPMSISEVYFAHGVPVVGEVDNIMAVHFLSYAGIVWFLYRTLAKDPDPSIASKVAPIRDRFFVNTLIKEEVVKSRFKESVEEALIEERIGNSVTYIAKNRDSFSELYNQFVNRVFKLALRNLPKDEKVRGAILRGLRGEATLEDYQSNDFQ